MLRLALVASLLFTLTLGTIAEASCDVCLASVRAERTGGGGISLRFTARGADLPETGTAVVMQVDGSRSKCINVSLRKVEQSGGVATYAGGLTSFYGNSDLTGRVDIAGEIYDFAAGFDGKPGTLQIVAAAASQVASTATSAPAAVATAAPTTAATAAPLATAEPQTAGAVRIPSPAERPVAWLGLVVILATLAGAYLDRRRALARATVA